MGKLKSCLIIPTEVEMWQIPGIRETFIGHMRIYQKGLKGFIILWRQIFDSFSRGLKPKKLPYQDLCSTAAFVIQNKYFFICSDFFQPQPSSLRGPCMTDQRD